MRISIRAFGIALVLSSFAASGRCDEPADFDWQAYPAAEEKVATPAAPPAAEHPAASPICSATAQSCDGISSCDGLGSCASPFEGALCERQYLLGNMCGLRDELGCHGITFNASTMQMYQGVTSGGINEGFEYAGRGDYFLNVNGEKAGLWKGFFIDVHGETRYGEDVNTDTGAIIPVNMQALFPIPNGDETALTGLKFTQALSEQCIVFAGKINTLDGFKMPFTGESAINGFWNLGMSFPVVVARTIPYSTLGAGAAVLKDGAPVASVMVLDTNNTPTENGFESFFDNGATVYMNVTCPTNFCGLPGHQGLSGTISSGSYNDLEPNTYFDPTVGLVVVPRFETGSWSMYYSGDQALYVNPNNPKQMWGVYTNIGRADNGPSPIEFSANVAFYGTSPISSRPLDTFGIGYSFVRYSSPVRNFAPVLLPIGDDQAIELFYNYAVTPWFHLMPDLQIVLPARDRTLPPNAQAIDNAVVFGVRAKIDF